ncbi:MAG: hypothetical protein N4A71_02380 [Carboxylicivirga sp.]|jgi:hypothetical protein|nr:hypothetical protein [Carboxylicivirga sp.]
MDDFKPIRNKIRTFTYHSLMLETLKVIREQENSSKSYAYWQALTILRWAYEFAEENYPPKTATRRDVLKLLKQIEELERLHSTFNPLKNGNVNKMFTILAYQQFQFQEHLWMETFSRQYLLFEKLKHKYDVREAFLSRTSISIRDFIKAQFFTWLWVTQAKPPVKVFNGIIDEELITVLKEIIGADNASNYYNLLTITRDKIKDIVTAEKGLVRNYNLHPFDASFYSRYPFILFGSKIWLPHSAILNITCNHYIYNYLKAFDSSFTTEFGHRIEKYIELGLKELDISYATEGELRNCYGRQHKVVDFLVDENVLIESKAIELNAHVAINPKDELLATSLKDSIVKAYSKQMIELAKSLPGEGPYYGIILTYKNLFLGNSQDIWEQFLKTESHKNIDISDTKILPVENLFFIDLQAWEHLVQTLKKTGMKLAEVLEKVKAADSKPETKKFSFDLHLDEYDSFNVKLEYLESVKEEATSLRKAMQR